MSKIVQILKSSDLESKQREVERLKKEIADLNVHLEINLDALEKLRMKSEQ
jgi:hypothetical protein